MYTKLMTVTALCIVALAGCDNAKSPNAVANDVAQAREKEANEVANARKDAEKADEKAAEKVSDKDQNLNNVEAKGNYDVALAKADGDHKVALDKCNALGGDAQSKCKDVADADYKAAKANAKATEVAATH